MPLLATRPEVFCEISSLPIGLSVATANASGSLYVLMRRPLRRSKRYT